MKSTKILLLSGVLVVGLSGLASAVDMSGRLGAGVNWETEASFSSYPADVAITDVAITSLSIKYHTSPKLSIAGLLGFSYDSFDPEQGKGESASAIGIGGKFFYNIREEKQMNLYIGGGLMILRSAGIDYSPDPQAGTGSVSILVFKIPGYLGSEFFFSGLPNLGFSVETGIEIIIGSRTFEPDVGDESSTGLFKFGTAGGIFSAGIHYYF